MIAQAIAKTNVPFMHGVSEVLGHEFTAEQRISVCNELECFVVLTMTLIKFTHSQSSEVLKETVPPMIEALGVIIGRAITNEEKAKLTSHVETVFALTVLVLIGQQKKEQEEQK